jgi:hypothetical protein
MQATWKTFSLLDGFAFAPGFFCFVFIEFGFSEEQFDQSAMPPYTQQ